MPSEEAKKLKPLNTAALKDDSDSSTDDDRTTEDDSEDAITFINELLKTSDSPSSNQNFWFPTPDHPGDLTTHTPIQIRILREIQELEEIQKLDPTVSLEDRETFLRQFNWNDSQPTPEQNGH